MRILIADDDLPLANFVAALLRSDCHDTAVVAISEAVAAVTEQTLDLLLLDLDVSDASELALLKSIRETKPHVPTLLLTASITVEDRVTALDSGADDLLVKPFVPSELAARVRALLRRSRPHADPILRAAGIELDRVRHIVSRNGREIELTPKEFGLLEYLMLNAGRDVSRTSIIRDVWKLTSVTSTNVIDVYINYLRRKLSDDASDVLIHTIRGAGYRIGGCPMPATSAQ